MKRLRRNHERYCRLNKITCVLVAFLLCDFANCSFAQRVPHGQDRPPGPALSPAEAIAKMTVPPGFTVEVVAAEPQIVNPVSMTFDERGRIWVTESLEYPRMSAGPGRDRVKILEDTDQDGRVDSVKIFAEGLNIPSGIAVGHGGVWVANAPDILFLKDTDGDDRADVREVVVTGFGRRDTHELPNSLTWGPDGYLYGLNGVFNPSVVRQGDREYRFTCALFRIDPRTRRFELFAEGTSNPWGIAWNPYGDAFLSACVIDHLWHLTETGYYHRQGGPYPPFTWKMGSIVSHKHQKAAYCGIHYFDSDAYPAEYRDRLYMGNIHGNCVNVDILERNGATYQARPADDFLSANDAWFMTVAQKTGPDGCLYVLDWYDRYHCYQDARRDPDGIDRLKGRLYRIRYRDTPRAPKFDLATASDERLVELLGSPNVYYRDIAQRLLVERNGGADRARIRSIVLADDTPEKLRMHALWSLVGTGQLDPVFLNQLLDHSQPELRAWGVRAAGNLGTADASLLDRIQELAADSDPRVIVQVAIAARKLKGADAIAILADCLINARNDSVIPHIVWQNLHPLLERHGSEFLTRIQPTEILQQQAVSLILPRVIDRMLAAQKLPVDSLAALVELLLSAEPTAPETAIKSLRMLTERVQTGELSGRRLEQLAQRLAQPFTRLQRNPKRTELHTAARELATSWGDQSAGTAVSKRVRDSQLDPRQRLSALKALIAGQHQHVVANVKLLLGEKLPDDIQSELFTLLTRSSEEQIARFVIAEYGTLAPANRPRAIELLTTRPQWSRLLMTSIANEQIPSNALNVNQVRKLLATGDEDLEASVRKHWGTVRSQRDPRREELIQTMRVRLRNTLGDPLAGRQVFQKVCAQCHVMHGVGEKVGPDITRNGRASFDQLLSNVFDPSLVIGAAYQPMTVVTTSGRVVTGLIVEDSPSRVVLKVQGGKLETIARTDIEDSAISQLSLMPEGLEKQLKPHELSDLFAYLTLDLPPENRDARRIPGTFQVQERSTNDVEAFGSILDEVMPGFRTKRSGEGGVALLSSYADRPVVVRTHPIDRRRGCTLTRTVAIPADATAQLVIEVTHDHRGDWKLLVNANGRELLAADIAPRTGENRWQRKVIPLDEFAGQKVRLELINQSTDWSYEFAYWARVDVEIETSQNNEPQKNE